MKNNQPVTQQQVPFPPACYLVSRTDLKGVITYANEAFIKISGFSRDELIGKSHNVVRHPDMPVQAFAEMWTTLKSGRPWRGPVKNRCKNGDHYWVEAFVVPVRKDGVTVGYMSVRTPLAAQAQAQAEARYRVLREDGGRRVRRPLAERFTRLSLKTRVSSILVGLLVLLLGVGGMGLYALERSNDALSALYRHEMTATSHVKRVVTLLEANRAQMLLALMHDPAAPYLATVQDHAVQTHVTATLANRAEIQRLIGELRALPLDDVSRQRLQQLIDARERFSREGVAQGRALLQAGQFAQLHQLVLAKINPLAGEVQSRGDALVAALAARAQARYAEARDAHDVQIRLIAAVAALAALLALGGGYLLLRAVLQPLRRASAHFGEIAEGRLTGRIDISGRDEMGLLLCNLATMQATLKAMLDEIQTTATTIETRCDTLDERVTAVAQQSQQQQQGASSVASATEQFSQSIREVAANAQDVVQAARQSLEQVHRSNATIAEGMAATERVAHVVNESNATIEKLNQSIVRIGDITEVIAGIASQTNLLALNAAIEAARAGEQGRGFAVVADEVRKLAERTTVSTADIGCSVDEIQRVTQEAVAMMDQAVREVETGVGGLRRSVSELDEVANASGRVNAMAEDISAAAGQQGAASEEVARNMQRISELIERNTASVHDAKDEMAGVYAQAKRLEALIGEFTLYETPGAAGAGVRPVPQPVAKVSFS